MFATTKCVWTIVDATGDGGAGYQLPAGRYELERIPCPLGHDCNWLVLKGTKIGASEGWWRDWKNGVVSDNIDHPRYGEPIDWGDAEIIIED